MLFKSDHASKTFHARNGTALASVHVGETHSIAQMPEVGAATLADVVCAAARLPVRAAKATAKRITSVWWWLVGLRGKIARCEYEVEKYQYGLLRLEV